MPHVVEPTNSHVWVRLLEIVVLGQDGAVRQIPTAELAANLALVTAEATMDQVHNRQPPRDQLHPPQGLQLLLHLHRFLRPSA